MVIIVSHSNITSDLIDEIIKIKSRSWPYTHEDQIDWLSRNIYPDDQHLLMYDSDSFLVGYLNLVKITLCSGSETLSATGIGNVCTYEKGKGDGDKLMRALKNHLTTNKEIGVLFCKDSLITFYERYGWKLTVIPNKVHLNNAMIFNDYRDIGSITSINREF